MSVYFLRCFGKFYILNHSRHHQNFIYISLPFLVIVIRNPHKLIIFPSHKTLQFELNSFCGVGICTVHVRKRLLSNDKFERERKNGSVSAFLLFPFLQKTIKIEIFQQLFKVQLFTKYSFAKKFYFEQKNVIS